MVHNLMQSDQIKNDAALSEIAPSEDTPLNELFTNLNARLIEPLSLSATGLDKVITVGPSIVTIGPSGKKKGVPQIKSVDLGTISGSVNFSAGPGGTTVVTGDVQSSAIPAVASGEYLRVGLETRSDKKIYTMFGTPGAVPTAPAFSKGAVEIGEALLQESSGSFLNIAMSAITQFGTGSGGSGSGTGVGGINYVDNFEGDIDVSKWQTYNDGATATPIDGIGGIATITLTKDTSSPLRAGGSFLITKPASNCQGQGVSTDLLTFDNMDKGRLINISFDYESSLTWLSIFVYDVTNNILITPLGDKSPYRGKTTYTYQFYSSATSNLYRLIFHVASTSTTTRTAKLDNVRVGPVDFTESIRRPFYQTSHGFSAGQVVYYYSGMNWGLASANTADYATLQNLAIVTDVIDSNNFVAVLRGWFRLPPGTKTDGLHYLSSVDGETTTSDNELVSVPLFNIISNEGFFDPHTPRRLTEEGDISFRPYNVSGGIAYLSGGAIRLSNGETIVSGEYNPKSYITVNLSTLVPSPTSNTTYYLYIDRLALADAAEYPYRKSLRAYNTSHFDLFTTPPDQVNPSRYIEVGHFRYTTDWSYLGWAASRHHDTLSDYLAYPETWKDVSISTNTVTTLTHNLSGAPQTANLYFYDSSLSERQPLDASSYIRDVDGTQVVVDSNGLTFNSGDYLEVSLTYTPTNANQVASMSSQFESVWFTDTATTTLAHNRSDMEDIKGIVVQEWDTTTGRRNVIPAEGLVTEFDNTNLYLNWSGLSPSSTLKYRITTSGNALPQMVPYIMGGFNKYVGVGGGSYQSLALALASAAPGDSILVGRSESISTAHTVSVSDIKIVFMPGVVVTQTAAASGMTISGSNVTVEGACYNFTGASPSPGIQITGDDCMIDKARIILNISGTMASGITLASGADRNYVNCSIKTVTGTLTASYTDSGANNDLIIRP